MIEAYEIGIKISAIDTLSRSLTRIISKLQIANAEVLKLTASLEKLNASKGFSFLGGGGSHRRIYRRNRGPSDIDYLEGGAGGYFLREGMSATRRAALEIGLPLGAADVAYHGIKDNANYQYLLASVQATRNATDAQMQQVNQILQQTSAQYGITLTKNAKMFHDIVVGSALSISQLSTAYPTLTQFADAYRLIKPGSDPQDSVTLMMKVAHATGNYSPANIKRIANAVLGFGMTTDVSSVRAQTALSYSIKAGISALGDTKKGLHEFFALMSTLSRQGNLRTLGGRDFKDFFLSTITRGSPNAAAAKMALGLWGPFGSTVIGADGKLNLPLMMSIMQQDKAKYPSNLLTSLEYQAFGKQAGLILSSMTSKNFMQQYNQSYAAQNHKSIPSIIKANNDTLVGQLQLLNSNMSLLLNAWGKLFVGRLTGLLKHVVNPGLSGWANYWNAPSTAWWKKESEFGKIVHWATFGELDSVFMKNSTRKNSSLKNKKSINLDSVYDSHFGYVQNIHTHINLDGRKIAEAVTKHQATAMTGEQSGPTHYNFLSNFTPPSISRVL